MGSYLKGVQNRGGGVEANFVKCPKENSSFFLGRLPSIASLFVDQPCLNWVCSVKDFCHRLCRRAVAAATGPAKGNIGNLDWIISKKSFAAHLSFRTTVSSLKTILGVSLSNFIISDKTECRQDVWEGASGGRRWGALLPKQEHDDPGVGLGGGSGLREQ